MKGGEWKLGSNEEPKPFQTVRVKQITMHPAYQPTSLDSDVALLHLENDLKFDKHIGQICVDESELEPTKSSDEECVTSGWGKEQIKCKQTTLKSKSKSTSKFRVELVSNFSFSYVFSLFHLFNQTTLPDHYLIHLQSTHWPLTNVKPNWDRSIQAQLYVVALKEIHVMLMLVAHWLVHVAMDVTC